MPTLQILSARDAAGSAACWSLEGLRRAMAAAGWRPEWRARAWPLLVRHDAVPGLLAGPGFELRGDSRGPGWLELRLAGAGSGDEAERELQRLLEVTRRPWGLLALLPRRRALPARLFEAGRDPAAGRRLAGEAVERLLAGRLS